MKIFLIILFLMGSIHCSSLLNNDLKSSDGSTPLQKWTEEKVYFEKLILDQNYDQALQRKDQFLKLSKDLDKGRGLNTATANTMIGRIFFMRKDYPLAIEHFETSETIIENAILKSFIDPKELSGFYYMLGTSYLENQNPEKALEEYQKKLDIEKQFFKDELNIISETQFRLGDIYAELKNWEQSELYFFESLKNLQRMKPASKVGIDNAIHKIYLHLGHLYLEKEEFDKSKEYYQKTVNFLLTQKSDQEFTVMKTIMMIANRCLSKDQDDLSFYFYKKLIDYQIQKNGESDDVFLVWIDLGIAYGQKKSYKLTIQSLLNSLELIQKKYGNENEDTAFVYTFLGTYYAQEKEFDKSIEFSNKALKIRINLYGENHYLVGFLYNFLADNYYLKKDYEKAEELALRSMEILDNCDWDEISNYKATSIITKKIINNGKVDLTSSIIDTYRLLGIIYSDTHRYQEAIDYLYKTIRKLEEKSTITKAFIARFKTDLGFVLIKKLNYYYNIKRVRTIYGKEMIAMTPGENEFQMENKEAVIEEAKFHILEGLPYLIKGPRLENNPFNLYNTLVALTEVYEYKRDFKEGLDTLKIIYDLLKVESKYSPIVKNQHLIEKIISNLEKQGDFYKELGKYPEAKEKYEEAYQLILDNKNIGINEKNKFYLGMINLYFYFGEMDKAYEISKLMYEEGSKLEIDTETIDDYVDSRIQMSNYYQRINNFHKAKEFLNEAQSKRDHFALLLDYNIDKILNFAWSDLYGRFDMPEKSIHYLYKIIDDEIKLNKEENNLDLARCYIRLGQNLSKKGEHTEALKMIKEGYEIFDRIYEKNQKNPIRGEIEFNLGSEYFKMGDYETAKEHLLKSLENFQENQLNNTIYTNALLMELGKVSLKQNKTELALTYFQKAEENTIHSQLLYYKEKMNYLWGEYYHSQQKYELSNQYLEEAIESDSFHTNRNLYIDSLRLISKNQFFLGNQDKGIETLKKAVNFLIDETNRMEMDKENFFQRNKELLDDLSQLYLERKEFESAYSILQLKKSYFLNEHFLLKKAIHESGIGNQEADEYLTKLNRLQSLQFQRESQLRNDESFYSRTYLDDQISNLYQWITEKEKEFSEKFLIFRLYKNNKFVKVKDIQNKLRNDTILLDYFLMNQSLIVFVISKKEFHTFIVDKKKDDWLTSVQNIKRISSKKRGSSFIILELQDGRLRISNTEECGRFQKGKLCEIILKNFQNGSYHLTKKNLGKMKKFSSNPSEVETIFSSDSSSLFKKLIQPFIKGNQNKIILSPDDELYQLPFSVLKDLEGKYLIESHSISYIQSISLWSTLDRDINQEYQKEILAIGDPIYDKFRKNPQESLVVTTLERNSEIDILDDIRLNNLPGSKKEISNIQEILKKTYKEGDYLLGINANKNELLKKLKSRPFHNKNNNYRIIHFSTHGLFFKNSSDLNSLALTNRKRAEQYASEELKLYEKEMGKLDGDGYLRMKDVVEMNMRSELILLSACETSLGSHHTGEGLRGLPQAFLKAGSKNVISTLWSISDLGTAEFMKHYYQRIYFKKESHLEALRNTQIEFLKKMDVYKDPYYWSGFVMYGLGDEAK
ncbi:MAG: CHAT domain-containing protein [Leptospiraceae bacterium]|nr:CHAT domain-containing protein [Leptospiraceae bacterium]